MLSSKEKKAGVLLISRLKRRHSFDATSWFLFLITFEALPQERSITQSLFLCLLLFQFFSAGTCVCKILHQNKLAREDHQLRFIGCATLFCNIFSATPVIHEQTHSGGKTTLFREFNMLTCVVPSGILWRGHW